MVDGWVSYTVGAKGLPLAKAHDFIQNHLQIARRHSCFVT